MIVTALEAASLWCPMVRSASANDQYCVADKCMMWRRLDDPRLGCIKALCQDPHATVEPTRPGGLMDHMTFVPFDGEDGHSAHWIESEQHWLDRHPGYCGLAGKPMSIGGLG